MTIKTATTISCTVICILIIILSLATNYWYEYEVELGKDGNVLNPNAPLEENDKASNHSVRYVRVGLWEQCEQRIFNHLKDNEYEEDETCSDYVPPDGVSNWSARRAAIVILYVLALFFTLIAFIFETVYCVTGKYYFPVGRTALLFFLSALVILIGLIVYLSTFNSYYFAFSWSYGAGWSAIVMYIISIILLYADK